MPRTFYFRFRLAEGASENLALKFSMEIICRI